LNLVNGIPVCYIILNDGITECYKISDGIFVPTHAVIKHESKEYTDRNDALYFNFLEKVKNGKKVTNFKTSRYYKMYLERIEKEHPEYLI
jgi:hypothetical protein